MSRRFQQNFSRLGMLGEDEKIKESFLPCELKNTLEKKLRSKIIIVGIVYHQLV